MKTGTMTLALAVSCAILLPRAGAQNFTGTLVQAETSSVTGTSLPPSAKAEATPAEPGPLYLVQNMANLNSRPNSRGTRQETTTALKGAETSGEQLDLLSATYRELAKPTTGEDCGEIGLSVRQRVEADPSILLKTVENEVRASPGCCCEIVKGAILAAGTGTETVVSIVETAITASPENMRLISQCAVAAAPEALAGIQALLAKLDPNAGEGSSAKSAKSGKDMVAAVRRDFAEPVQRPNPLDIGLYFWAPPPPILILPPVVTQVNP